MSKFRSFALFLVVFLANANSYASSIGVFLPGIKSATKVTEVLKADPAFKGFEIFVFAKFKDFSIALKSKNFEHIITTSNFLIYTKNIEYKPIYQFVVDGKEDFQYRLVALDKKWNKKNFLDGTMVVVETLERQETKDFVSDVLGVDQVKRIKNISKVEDLLPILAMANADVALVSPEMISFIKQNFKAEPAELSAGKKLPQFMLASRRGNEEKAKAFSSLAKDSLVAMGASGLKPASL